MSKPHITASVRNNSWPRTTKGSAANATSMINPQISHTDRPAGRDGGSDLKSQMPNRSQFESHLADIAQRIVTPAGPVSLRCTERIVRTGRTDQRTYDTCAWTPNSPQVPRARHLLTSVLVTVAPKLKCLTVAPVDNCAKSPWPAGVSICFAPKSDARRNAC